MPKRPNHSHQPALAIEVHDLVKQYPGEKVQAVAGVDLEVKDGEIYGFLGPNGAGKSTTIGVLVTSLFPTSGTVIVNGFDVSQDPDKVRATTGVVYQQVSLDEKLTVEENMRSHAVLYDVANYAPLYSLMSDAYKKRLQELLELVGLPQTQNTVVEKLSGGMRRRIDMAKSLFHIPKILFLDEPTTGLDPQSRRVIWQYLTDLQKEKGFTIFLTTQYLEEAEICDRISIIDQGKILVTDSPNQLKKQVGAELLYLQPSHQTQLEKELTRLKFQYQIGKDNTFILETQKLPAQKVLSQIKTELKEINIRKPSLDDVFIHLTGRKME
jgi:ABC-2 type transport system ATP-binding protein